MRLPPPVPPAVIDSGTESAVERIEILKAFVDLPDVRRAAGKRHPMALCLALFTLAVTAGNRGFIAIGDWLRCYRSELIALFKPPKQCLPSYSTIRRVLLKLDYSDYSTEIRKGHGRREKRVISLCTTLDGIKPWPGLKTLIRVESERRFKKGGQPRIETETRYYVTSFLESAESFAQRIRGYWGMENKVHYVRDVTQGEDASRIRMHQLPQIFAVARNFAINLYRSNEFSNMAQAERLCKFGLDTSTPTEVLRHNGEVVQRQATSNTYR